MKGILRSIAVCSLLVLASPRAQAQLLSETINPLLELYKLHSVFADDRALSFECAYYMEAVDSVTTKDTLTGFFKFFQDQYWIKMDSVEQLQDKLFSVTAYHEQQIMLVRNPVPFSSNVFQANVLDSVFYNIYTDSITISDSGIHRRLVFHFKPMVLYTKYEVLYDTTNYYIKTIDCSMRRSVPVESENSTPLDNERFHLKVVFSNHRVDEDSPSIFSTARFIEQKGAAYLPKSPYNSYQLVNSINQ